MDESPEEKLLSVLESIEHARASEHDLEVCAEDFDQIVASKDARMTPSETLRIATLRYKERLT